MAGKPRKRHSVVQPLNESYRYIALTRNQNAIVDVCDFEWLSRWNWTADWNAHTKSFYARNRAVGKMHRLILGCTPSEQGDHRDGNTLNNRRNNLRKATSAQNRRNAQKRANNTSGYKGVSWYKNTQKWHAQISKNGKRVGLGYFLSAEDAAHAYDKAANECYGEFASLNFHRPNLR